MSRCWDVANFCPLVVFVAGVRVVEFGSYLVEFPWRRSRRLTSHVAVDFFRAAAAALMCSFLTQSLNFECSFISSFNIKKSKHGIHVQLSVPYWHRPDSPIYLRVLYNRPA